MVASFWGAGRSPRRGVPDREAAAERETGPLRAGELVDAPVVRREGSWVGFLSFLAVRSLVVRW